MRPVPRNPWHAVMRYFHRSMWSALVRYGVPCKRSSKTARVAIDDCGRAIGPKDWLAKHAGQSETVQVFMNDIQSSVHTAYDTITSH